MPRDDALLLLGGQKRFALLMRSVEARKGKRDGIGLVWYFLEEEKIQFETITHATLHQS
jgi:hypothetical protein